MAEAVKELTVVDKIIAALDGRKQRWLVGKMNEYAANVSDLTEKYKLTTFNDVKLSRRMNGNDDFEDFELKAISKILKIKF